MSALVVNLACGPGGGKSTTSALVFALLKEKGIEVELVREYAKDLVWAEHADGVPPYLVRHQVYVFGEQLRRLDDLAYHPKLAVVVNDSPLFLASIFAPDQVKAYHQLVMHEFYKHRNLNVFLQRVKPYHDNGRLQTETEAQAIDERVRRVLTNWDATVPGSAEGAQQIADLVVNKLAEV